MTQKVGGWGSEDINIKLPRGEEREVHTVVPIPAFCLYLVAHSDGVDLVDFKTSTVIHSFQTEPMLPKSLQQIYSSKNLKQGLNSFTLSYVNAETGDLVLQTYVPDEDEIFWPGVSEDSTRAGATWNQTREIRRHVKNPGLWAAVCKGCIIGIRRIQPPQAREPPPASTTGSLRRRAGLHPETRQSSATAGKWEVWVMRQLEAEGEDSYESRPLSTPEEDKAAGDQLMVTELGPIIKLGTGSVAVGFGNVVKIISAGHEHFDSPSDRLAPDKDLINLTNRRRRIGGASARGRADMWS